MVNQTIDERSLSQIRLTSLGRPIHIYFDRANVMAEEISLSTDGLLQFHFHTDGLARTIHSDGSPAIFYEDGSVAWVQNGKYHRTDGPAIIDNSNNSCQYWELGEPILPDDTDAVEKRDGSNHSMLAVVAATLGMIGLLSYKKHIANKSSQAAAIRSVITAKR